MFDNEETIVPAETAEGDIVGTTDPSAVEDVPVDTPVADVEDNPE